MGAEVSITVKAGPGYDEPWVTFKGNVDEVGHALAHFRHEGLFGSVKAASQEFSAAPATDAKAAIKNLNDAGMGAQELPEHAKPKCPDCGGETTSKRAHSTKQNRDYKGYFCIANKDHRPAQFQWVS